MKRIPAIFPFVIALLLLAACAPASSGSASQSAASLTAPQRDGSSESATLAELYGEDYAKFIRDTIEMQMGNRMDKNPDIKYLPITEEKSLTEYVSIDDSTEFYFNDDGNPVIVLPAGSVTSETFGAQEFILPKP
ncbi:RsiV family protein [Oscillibacter sp. MSJ-2]|uniref:RsiV family protein n=1 Tax=Dysosmobacter acutus TaxID=2841504 RepID=A0ABS6FCB9_9FIRM|nr:DUF3298 domain-containing protein [Dysosmobacter acutus]MBU5627934.1 RsiV family protein [Dysosmobacter acutus]